MKQLAVMLLVTTVVAVSPLTLGEAVARKNPDTGPGCGVGTTLWADYDHPKNIAPQVLMFSTNATFLNTVSISFDTSGCTSDGVIMAEHKVSVFVASNYEDLSQDMARGDGEHLASLATLMGVASERHAEFFALTNERFATRVESGTLDPVTMHHDLYQLVAERPALVRGGKRR